MQPALTDVLQGSCRTNTTTRPFDFFGLLIFSASLSMGCSFKELSSSESRFLERQDKANIGFHAQLDSDRLTIPCPDDIGMALL